MDSYTRLRSDSGDRFDAALRLRKSTWHFVYRDFKVAVFSVLSLGIG
jgi:hypothetical protein